MKYTKKQNLLLSITVISLALGASAPTIRAAQEPRKLSNVPALYCAHQPPGYGYHPGFATHTGAHHPSTQTGNVNIHFSSSNSSEQAARLHAEQHAQQFQHQHVENITLVSIARDCESFLSSYRWTLIFGFMLAAYAMMYKRIKDDQDFLHRGKNWANWRAYDTQKIESCLAADIQYRYFNPQDPANHAAPLAECALDLEHEHMRYSRIMRLYKWLKKWYLYLLFPMSEEDLREVREARERFEAIRRIYLRLIASRNPYVSSQISNSQVCMLPCCNPVQ